MDRWHIGFAVLLCSLSNPAGNETRHVLVFDLGGGTFDTVLLERSIELLQVHCTFVFLLHHVTLQFLRRNTACFSKQCCSDVVACAMMRGCLACWTFSECS